MSVGSTSPNDCVCTATFYSDGNGTCQSCPEGASCVAGTTVWSMDVWSGWWREGVNHTIPRECPIEALCVGGRINGTRDPNAQCRRGSNGPFCGVCDHNWRRATGGVCVKCGSPAIEWIRFFVWWAVIMVCTIVALLVFRCIHHRHVGVSTTTMSSSRRQKRASVVTAFESMETSGKNIRDRVMMRVRIIIAFLQVVSSFGSTMSFTLPSLFLSWIGLLGVLDLNVMGIVSVDCLHATSHYDRTLVMCLLPAGVVLLLAVVHGVVSRRWRVTKPHRVGWLRDKCSQAALFLIFLIYPSVCTCVMCLCVISLCCVG